MLGKAAPLCKTALHAKTIKIEEDEGKDKNEIYANGRIVERFLAKEEGILKKKAEKKKNAAEMKSQKA